MVNLHPAALTCTVPRLSAWALARTVSLTRYDAGVVVRRLCGQTGGEADDEHTRLLITAVDELWRDRFLGDRTWASLSRVLTTRQLVEICALTGVYAMTTMLHSTFPDDVAAPFPHAARMPAGRAASAAGAARAVSDSRVHPISDSQLHRPAEPRVRPGGRRQIGWTCWAAARFVGWSLGCGDFHLFSVLGRFRWALAPAAPILPAMVGDYLVLGRREMELATLRLAWRTRCEYQAFQHDNVSRMAGVTTAEVAATRYPLAEGRWGARDLALLTAVDELITDRRIGPATLHRLRERYSTAQIAALIGHIGGCDLLTMLVNSLGIEPEPGGWHAPWARLLVNFREHRATALGEAIAARAPRSRQRPRLPRAWRSAEVPRA